MLRLTAAVGRSPAGPALAVPLRPGPDGLRPAALADEVRALLPGGGGTLAAVLDRCRATGEAGEVVDVPLAGLADVPALYLVGVGDGSPRALRKAAAEPTLRSALALGAGPQAVAAVAEASVLAAYRFRRASRDPGAPRLEEVELLLDGSAAARAALERATAVAAAVVLARDLANTPSLEKSPDWLAREAARVARRCGLAVTVRDEKALSAEGFGGLLAVGGGSARPPRLVELRYEPQRRRRGSRHVVLVGKGITFDSGGLSLKPADAMTWMKTDMAGAAAVVGAMSALAALDVPHRVTGLVAAAENMPSGSAMRPGDVVRHYGGRTVEVLNTDAEGRLVLADALAYADAALDPDVLVDLATLTGAATRGLGRRHGALYTAADDLAEALLAAAEAGGERLWRMPLVADYRDALDSEVADLRNVADASRHYSGGSIVAALFLREFVGARRWAHLDIAGPARAEGDEDEVTKGATGYGVRTLLRWLAG